MIKLMLSVEWRGKESENITLIDTIVAVVKPTGLTNPNFRFKATIYRPYKKTQSLRFSDRASAKLWVEHQLGVVKILTDEGDD